MEAIDSASASRNWKGQGRHGYGTYLVVSAQSCRNVASIAYIYTHSLCSLHQLQVQRVIESHTWTIRLVPPLLQRMKQTYSFTAAFGSLLLFVLTTVEARKYGLSFKPDKGVTSLSGYRNLNTTIVNSELKLSRGDRKARLTWNDFSEHGGSGKAECTEQFYPSSKRVVALSTELFRKKKTCGKTIKIYYKGKVAKAEVVDECAFKDGCKSNTIDASTGVWHDLGEHELGEVSVTWSKA